MIFNDFYEQYTPDSVKTAEKTQETLESVYEYLKDKKVNELTEIITTFIKNKYFLKTMMSDKKRELWVYDEGIYIPYGESIIRQECRKLLGKAHSKYLSDGVIEKISVDTMIDSKIFFNQQNEYKDLICLKNGILNIETRKLMPFNPNIYFFNKLPVNFDPEATCDKITTFIEEITEKAEDVLTIQEMFGYCLLKEYKYEKAFMLHGSGRNGKSKLLDLITLLIGSDSISNTPLTQLEEDGAFSVINLHNKLANVAADVTKQALNDSGMFKSLVGRDTIQAQRKYKESIEFKNYAKLIFATNTLPQPNVISEAFWLRWVLIKFPMKFLPQKEIDALSVEERLNVKLQIPELISQISTPDQISGLLNWSLDGLDRLSEQKDFTFTKTVRVVEREWLRQSNSLIAFVEDSCSEDYDSFITVGSFKRYYHDYCRKHNISTLSDKVIGTTLTKNYAVNYGRVYVDDENGKSKQVRVWEGIRLRFVGESSSQTMI